MNIRWLRDNLTLWILGLVFLVILGGLSWQLRKNFREQDELVTNCATKETELKNLQSAKEFPSIDNINVVNRDAEMVKKLYADMHHAANRVPLTPPVTERDIDFSQLMSATVKQLAETAQKHHVAIPDAFAFGFSRYEATLPCRNPVARGEECKKLLLLLGKQLVVVEKLTNLMIDSKVDAIQAVRRTDVETGEAGGDALAAPISADPKSLYQTYPFELQFTCDTVALRELINGLAKAEYLFVIRWVKIDTGMQRVRTPGMPEEPDPAGTPEANRLTEARRLNVTMRLDLIEFATPPKPKAGKTG